MFNIALGVVDKCLLTHYCQVYITGVVHINWGKCHQSQETSSGTKSLNLRFAIRHARNFPSDEFADEKFLSFICFELCVCFPSFLGGGQKGLKNTHYRENAIKNEKEKILKEGGAEPWKSLRYGENVGNVEFF